MKNSVSNSIDAFIVYFHKRTVYHSFQIGYNWNENDIVRGYRYDSSTGVRTFKAYNVSGNRHFKALYGLDGGWLAGTGEVNLLSRTAYDNYVYADMIGYDREPERQKVTNNCISETLSLTYNIGWFTFGPGGSLSYRHSGAERSDFRSFTAWDFGYGLSGSMAAPMGFEISTDITMNSRRGYSQQEMNDNRLIWNARATYKLLNGKLLLILSARDILGKEKSLNYSVNAQGRTETRYQILPRYVMLSLQYRMDFRPRREKKTGR